MEAVQAPKRYQLPREKVWSVLKKNMPDGILHVPKEYGMFIAR